MKKVIIMSIVVSGLLFGANVDGLKINQENSVERTKINAATIKQGETKILGEATVKNLSIGKKVDGNTIEDSVINSTDTLDFTSREFDESEYYDRERDESIITQGRTIIIDAKTDTLTIDSDSKISNGTSINTAVGNSVKIDQGFTLIEGHGQKVVNTRIVSDNEISNTDIQGDGEGSTSIKQANFIMKDDGAGSTVTDVKIDSTNIISDAKIGHADIRQSYTSIEDGAIFHDSKLKQTNLILGDTEIKEFSSIGQGTTSIRDSQASIKQEVVNVIADVQGESSSAVDSVVRQADIRIEDDSKVKLTLKSHKNEIRDVELVDSSLSQDVIYIYNESTVDNFKQQADNRVLQTTLEDSNIEQNHLTVNNSLLNGDTASLSIQNNSVTDSDLQGSYIVQADVRIKDSKVRGLTVSEENKVHESSFNNAKLTQGQLIISSL